MPTAAQTVNKKFETGSLPKFGRWLGSLKNPKPQATAIIKQVDGMISDSASSEWGKYAVMFWKLQVDGLARDLLGKKPRIIPKGVTVLPWNDLDKAYTVTAPKGLTLKQVLTRASRAKPDRKRPGAAQGWLPGAAPGARPPALFPAKKDRPKPWQVEPDRKIVSRGIQVGAKIKRVPVLERLPAKLGGPAWKKFFKKHAGRDLDDPSNIRVLPDLGPGAGFRPGERLEGPKGSGWTMVYFVTDASSGELALHAHALQNDSYVASWYTVIAPREPLEKDEMALKMVTASAIEGARRALTTIARQYGTKLPAAASSFTPTPRAYHAMIAKKHGADLRGSPLYAEVNWSRKTLVNPNDDFFGSLA
jgi:hypothetical protein